MNDWIAWYSWARQATARVRHGISVRLIYNQWPIIVDGHGLFLPISPGAPGGAANDA